MSSAGKWDHRGKPSEPYGDETTYTLGATFLDGLEVEDWGCGLGWYKRFHKGPYLGIDGSPSPFADVVCDLTHRTSTPEAIFMRHVLEHNDNWRGILRNVLSSFQKRAVIVVFTPFQQLSDKVLTVPGLLIPDIGLHRHSFMLAIVEAGVSHREQRVDTKTAYNSETVFFLERP